MEKLYDCNSVATRYGVGITTVWAWIRDKKLSAVRVGKSYRIRERDLIAFEKKNQTIQE